MARFRKQGFAPVAVAARDLIRAPMAKRGFAESRLLTEWDAVVGAAIAPLCRPLRLTHAAKEGFGGTLILGVTGARALEVQHLLPTVTERVNAHYGYRAVSRIRLQQIGAAAMARMVPPRRALEPLPDPGPAVQKAVSPVADPDLRGALARLGQNIATRSRQKTG